MKTRFPGLLIVVPWLFVGCSDSGGAASTPADMAAPASDMAVPAQSDDLAMPAPADLVAPPTVDMSQGPDLAPAPKPDMAMLQRCRNAGDCRLYSSYCSTNPCHCLPLLATDPDPMCAGNQVPCLVDPCKGKVAACDPNTGLCLVQ